MSKKILVVEDDEAISAIIETILKMSGFDVEIFANAKEFSTHLESFEPELILLDIRLPDGDGTELCKSVKLNEATKKIPVILMSAHVNSTDMIRDAGADSFISKPFDIDNLVEEVNKYL